ncbi:hypothetical protein MMC30_004913 [Trapelia coarctata]|nr:hypothetical protein [Trapelia coarctata]
MCDISRHHCANPKCTATKCTLKVHCISNQRKAKKLHEKPALCKKEFCLFSPPDPKTPPWTCHPCREKKIEAWRKTREEEWIVEHEKETKVRFEEGLKGADEALEKIKSARVMEIEAILND